MNPRISQTIKLLAQSPVLLVASDYDGTLAPIVSDPLKAKPHKEAILALKTLASIPQTHSTIISGRSLELLGSLTKAPDGVHLVGSHGSEFDPDFAGTLSKKCISLKKKILKEIKEAVKYSEGYFIEEKPVSVGFHFRNADPKEAAKIVKKLNSKYQKQKDVFIKHGKKVIEFTIVKTSKGEALERIRRRVGATAVLFIGDDLTDEDAFKTLSGPDLGIKVGDGPSIAKERIKDTNEVARILALITELRCKWLEGATAHSIESHSFLSDLRTNALISPHGTVSWLCMPRIDSNALFSALIGGSPAGYFAIKPKNETKPIRQYYQGNTLQLVTEWKKMKVLDYLDCSGGRTNQRAGRTDLIRVIEGSGTINFHFAPRLDFGRIPTKIKQFKDGLQIESSLDPIVLRSHGIKWKILKDGPHHTARAEVVLKPKKPITIELKYGTGNISVITVPEIERRRQTTSFWSNWANQLNIPSKIPDFLKEHLVRSALVLKGLCYGPTGGIAAAATTSLPETLGGVRNWDYRFSWLRDGALTAHSLLRLGSMHEAMQFLDWVLHVLDRCLSPERLRPLYTVTGHEVPGEASVSELSGYAGSRPVRLGNSASYQVQLDVFGPIVDLIWELAERGAPLSTEHWRLVEAMVFAVEKRWKEPDNGIWEIRGAKKHHVHSKLMCWLTVERALNLSQRILRKRNPQWEKLLKCIRADILKKGWNEKIGSFTIAYGGKHFDAANLLIGLTRFLPPEDKRYHSTIRAIEKNLKEGGTVYRYHGDDSLPGTEGGFNL